ncbi:hypothetical protein Droror1_Dr00024481 [Drosera rotundifolia]
MDTDMISSNPMSYVWLQNLATDLESHVAVYSHRPGHPSNVGGALLGKSSRPSLPPSIPSLDPQPTGGAASVTTMPASIPNPPIADVHRHNERVSNLVLFEFGDVRRGTSYSVGGGVRGGGEGGESGGVVGEGVVGRGGNGDDDGGWQVDVRIWWCSYLVLGGRNR